MSEEKTSPQPIPIEQFDESVDDDSFEPDQKDPPKDADQLEKCTPEKNETEADATEPGSQDLVMSQMSSDERSTLPRKDKEITELRKQIFKLLDSFPSEIRDVDVLTSSHVLELVEPISFEQETEKILNQTESGGLQLTSKLLASDLPTGMPWDAWPLLSYLDKNTTPLSDNTKLSLNTSEGNSVKKLSSQDLCIFGKKPLEYPLDLCTCTKCKSLVIVTNYPRHYEFCSKLSTNKGGVHSEKNKFDRITRSSAGHKEAELLGKRQRSTKAVDQQLVLAETATRESQSATDFKGRHCVKHGNMVAGTKNEDVHRAHKRTKQHNRKKALITDRGLIRLLDSASFFVNSIQKIQYNQFQQSEEYFKPVVKSNILKRIYSECFSQIERGPSYTNGTSTNQQKSPQRRSQGTVGGNDIMQKHPSLVGQRGVMCTAVPQGFDGAPGTIVNKTMIGKQGSIKTEAKKTKRGTRKKSSKSGKLNGEQQIIAQQKIAQVIQGQPTQQMPQQQPLSPSVVSGGIPMNKIQNSMVIQFQQLISQQPQQQQQQPPVSPQQMGAPQQQQLINNNNNNNINNNGNSNNNNNNNNFYLIQRNGQPVFVGQKMQVSTQQQHLMQQAKSQQMLRQMNYITRMQLGQGVNTIAAGGQVIGGPRLQQMNSAGSLGRQWIPQTTTSTVATSSATTAAAAAAAAATTTTTTASNSAAATAATVIKPEK